MYIKVGNTRTKRIIVLGILTQSKKSVCISSYYDELPMCKISKPNESPSQTYPCDGQMDNWTNGRTDECEFISHRFVKPVTKNQNNNKPCYLGPRKDVY